MEQHLPDPPQDEEYESEFSEEDEELQPQTDILNSLKRKEFEDEDEKKVKDEIITLLCRYPGFKLRSNIDLIHELDGMKINELKNVYQNLVNDITFRRGTPSADVFLVLSSHYITTNYAPSLTQKLLADEELRVDLEGEILKIFGLAGSKINIIFRYFLNLYKALFPEFEVPLTWHKKQEDAEETSPETENKSTANYKQGVENHPGEYGNNQEKI